tara:strand:+ start:733 stop:924 length:192 start_codon:yes stop_codon:yes gene_type:complete
MKTNLSHLIFFVIMILLWLVIMISFFKIGKESTEKRQKYLRESFSPMTDDAEVQEAYDVIRNN